MAVKKYRKYELVYLVQPEATDEERARVQDRINTVFANSEAWVLNQEEWGKRKLSYEIQKHSKAHYHYIVYLAAPGVSTELERVLRLQDACIRFMTIKLEDQIREERVAELTAPGAHTAVTVNAQGAHQAPAAQQAAPVAAQEV